VVALSSEGGERLQPPRPPFCLALGIYERHGDGYGRESGIAILQDEFSLSVLLLSGQHGLLVGCEIIHRKFPLHDVRE
jgi:hypothetical protein